MGGQPYTMGGAGVPESPGPKKVSATFCAHFFPLFFHLQPGSTIPGIRFLRAHPAAEQDWD